jgi:hypothetical protein
MFKKFSTVFIAVLIFLGLSFVALKVNQEQSTGAPPYGESEDEAPDLDPYSYLRNWVRPDGPPKVALQVGHLKSSELPDELERIRGNTGSSGGGKWEWEVNKSIAEKTAVILKEKGIEVEIIPATVPPKYWADIFVAIHADGSTDRSTSGYKFAAPWRDFSGKADDLVSILETKYEDATNLEKDPNITRNMRGYYAFSWWRYEHAIHPMTTAVIAETGFLTNRSDQKLLINTPEIPAQAIADGITEHLENEGLLSME